MMSMYSSAEPNKLRDAISQRDELCLTTLSFLGKQATAAETRGSNYYKTSLLMGVEVGSFVLKPSAGISEGVLPAATRLRASVPVGPAGVVQPRIPVVSWLESFRTPVSIGAPQLEKITFELTDTGFETIDSPRAQVREDPEEDLETAYGNDVFIPDSDETPVGIDLLVMELSIAEMQLKRLSFWRDVMSKYMTLTEYKDIY